MKSVAVHMSVPEVQSREKKADAERIAQVQAGLPAGMARRRGTLLDQLPNIAQGWGMAAEARQAVEAARVDVPRAGRFVPDDIRHMQDGEDLKPVKGADFGQVNQGAGVGYGFRANARSASTAAR